jgi:hypothetical protein
MSITAGSDSIVKLFIRAPANIACTNSMQGHANAEKFFCRVDIAALFALGLVARVADHATSSEKGYCILCKFAGDCQYGLIIFE